jgi:hypothetical protein
VGYKIEGIFAMNPPANELEKISMASLYLEGDAYDWFTWWSKKTSGLSMLTEQMFTKDLLKRFHDDEEDDTFTRFTHLQQTWTINEYTHEWEVLATRFLDLTEDQLLKLYI